MRHFRDDYPFTNQLALETVPLIRIGADGTYTYEQKKEAKLAMLNSRQEGDKFLVPVPGKRRTDVFELTEEDFAELRTLSLIQ